MAWKDYSCEKCATLKTIDVSVNASHREQTEQILFCEWCKSVSKFDRVYTPLYLTAGIMTHKYTGQTAATSGWGTYNLDYGKAGSDLVSGRAQEVAERINGHKLNEGRDDRIERAAKHGV